ncbi:MAG: potassium channel family protein [Candidatus Micrarchaeia archaeon]
MASIGQREGMLVSIALLLFLASMLLALLSGMSFALALVWNLLNVLGIAYSAMHISNINNPYLVAADFADSIIFVLLAFFLASWFYSIIKSINISDKLVASHIRRLSGHVIITPYNSFAEALIRELDSAKVRFVVISDDRSAVDALRNRGYTSILSPIGSVGAMQIAGIEKASHVVACSNDDTLNTLIAVTAKSVNKGIKVISRAKKIENLPKISKAGVSRVILPEESAGDMIGKEILKRAVFS